MYYDDIERQCNTKCVLGKHKAKVRLIESTVKQVIQIKRTFALCLQVHC